MAGLVAALRAQELGARVHVYEKLAEPGGAMALSSGVAWRYRDLPTFLEQCPGGDPELQRLVLERADGAFRWLARHGVRTFPWTGNPLTVGVRFDPRDTARTLAERVDLLRLSSPLQELPDGPPVVLATGGFQADRALVRHFVTANADSLTFRAAPGSTGDALRLALGRGAALSAGMDEFYGRSLPAPPAIVPPSAFVALSQLYARHAVVTTVDGEARRSNGVSWHETEVVQWIARAPGARGWYVVPSSALDLPAGPSGTVRDAVEGARRAGGRVEDTDEGTAVLVAAGITTTLGGLRVDTRARILDSAATPIPGLFAAGADTGGISTGGYSSGLAAALVLGLTAAESALGV
jgi:succinate dehydrogenase/fumarate reductase flavoprotein subunit